MYLCAINISCMEKLTAKEEEVLGLFWKKGPLYVREIVELYEDPKPHFNTISTIVRALEEKDMSVILPKENPINIMLLLLRKTWERNPCPQSWDDISKIHTSVLSPHWLKMAIFL